MTKLIGTKPHQAPKNADLGKIAYQDDRITLENITLTNNNSTVGKIGSFGDDIYVGTDNTGIRYGYAGINTLVPFDPATATSASAGASDGVMDLGHAQRQYRDLFLSGDLNIDGNVIIRGDGGLERNARQYIDMQNTAGVNGSTEGFHSMYHSAYKKINTALGVQHGNGNWYVALAGTSGTQYIYYAVSVNSAKNLRVLGTWSNFADSVTRTASISYSTDQGATWTVGSTGTFASSSGSSREFTLNLTQPYDHLGTVLVRFSLTDANNNLVGLNRVYFESIGSSAGISLIPNYVEPTNFTIIQDDSNQSDRPRYHYRAGKVMASNFSNPTQNILTVNSAQVNHHLSVYVRMRHSVYTTNGGSDLSEGMAEYVSGGTNTTSGNLNIVSSTGGNLSAGNLAWSGNTLQVTGVRNSNYDRYYLTVEVIEANNVSWTWNI